MGWLFIWIILSIIGASVYATIMHDKNTGRCTKCNRLGVVAYDLCWDCYENDETV